MRRTFPLCLAVLLALSPRAARAASPPRTNLVFITSDDHRWDALGAAGNAAIHTPALDRLAARGIYFRQATAHVAQCLPVRGTLLTGLAVHQHGEVSHEHAVPEDGKPDRIHSLPTVPRLLREAGYRTVLIGKWHLAANPWQSGFSEVRSWLPAGGADYQDPLLARGNSRRLRKTKGNTQRIFGDEAVRFVRSAAAREKPFFLWLAFTAPHVPMEPNSAASRRLYADKTPAELRPPGFTGGVASDWRPYYAAISDLDREVGRLQAALEESGLAPSTAVVFLGDNGHMMGQRGIGADGGRGKVVPYEASIRVPLIVAGAQGPAGPSDLPASSLDLPVTLLRLAGIEPPAAWPGRDLLAARRDPENGLEDAFTEWADEKGDRWPPYRLVRTPSHKLIVWKDPAKPVELYDLAADPAEETNLYGRPEVGALQRDLEARLQAWMERTEDPARQWPKRNDDPTGPLP